MKKFGLRFEAVPLDEVINDAAVRPIKKPVNPTVEKLTEKEGPYAVRDEYERAERAHPHHFKRAGH